MVDWVAAVLKCCPHTRGSPAETPTPMVSGDPVASPLLNKSSSDGPLLKPAPPSDGQYRWLRTAVPQRPSTDFHADDLVESFCIQTVDGGLSDTEAIENIVTALPPLSYDAMLAEIATIHIPSPEDHAEAITRWIESVRLQRRYITKLLERSAQQ